MATTESHPHDIDFNGVSVPGVTIIHGKGKAAGKSFLLFANPLEEASSLTDEQKLTKSLDFFRTLANLIGVEQLVDAIYKDVVRPACNHASSEARDSDNTIDDSKWVETVLGAFTRQGLRLSEINDEIQEHQGVINPLVKEMIQAGGQLPDEKQRLLLREIAEVQRLTGLKANKEAKSDRMRATRASSKK